MADSTTQELQELFSSPPATDLGPDVLGELRSILRLHSISVQELFYKWESYSIKMGSEDTKLDLDTVRAFKKDVQESLERGMQVKTHPRSVDKRSNTAGSRIFANTSEMLAMLDGRIPPTPKAGHTKGARRNNIGRRADPGSHGTARVDTKSSTSAHARPNPSLRGGSTHARAQLTSAHYGSAVFAERANAGQVLEQLGEHIEVQAPPMEPPAEPRIKVTGFTDLKKFSYRPLAMHLSEASEVLDDRIDEFATLVQVQHSLPDDAFGNPTTQSTTEIVAVGRIASDSLDSKLNTASLVLEASRRMGAGIRIPLKMDGCPSYEFFPGQVVALRGVNASGQYFSVKEILDMPQLPPTVTEPAVLDIHNERLRSDSTSLIDGRPRPLHILLAAGPYTTDDSLAFEPLHALCEKAAMEMADALLLHGPFIDTEHPLIATGDFDLPEDMNLDDDTATLTAVFRGFISPAIQRLAKAVPGITIILVPSVRDAINKHVSWPQEQLPRKDLGLPPRRARLVPNPVMVSLNELLVGLSSQDVLSELRMEEVVGPRPKTPGLLDRLPKHLIEQRHFFPLFPPVSRSRLPRTGTTDVLPTGAMLDTSYLKLGEWLNVKPDILITPSALPVFAKVVESVLVINPGTLSKRKGPGTYARIIVHPIEVTDEDRAKAELMEHLVYKRSRVEIIRI